MDRILAVVLEGFFTGCVEMVSGKYSNPTAEAISQAEKIKRVTNNLVLLCAVAFILGLATLYFFPVLAFRLQFFQWANAFFSPLISVACIYLWRVKVSVKLTIS